MDGNDSNYRFASMLNMGQANLSTGSRSPVSIVTRVYTIIVEPKPTLVRLLLHPSQAFHVRVFLVLLRDRCELEELISSMRTASEVSRNIMGDAEVSGARSKSIHW